MKRYSIFHPLLLSFYSKSLYQDVGRNWKGVGFLYLLMLLALCWIPITVKFHFSSATFQKEAESFISQVPPITIKDGKVSTDVQTPYFIKDEKGKTIAIIDLTGEHTSLEGPDVKILLTETKVMFRRSRTETRLYDLSSIRSFSLDQAKLRNWLQLAVNWLAIVAYPLVLLFSYVYRIIQALLYGALGVLFSKILNTSLSYQTSVRLAVVAVTPAIIFDTIRDVDGTRVPAWWIICFVIAMVYLFFAVKANSEGEAVT